MCGIEIWPLNVPKISNLNECMEAMFFFKSLKSLKKSGQKILSCDL